MRLDVFLKTSHMISRNDIIRYLCEEGILRVNGSPRKHIFEVKTNDEIEYVLFNEFIRLRILAFPTPQFQLSDQWSCLEILEKKKVHTEIELLVDPFAPHPKTPPSN